MKKRRSPMVMLVIISVILSLAPVGLSPSSTDAGPFGRASSMVVPPFP